jgi:hypothetical protein
MSLDEDFLDVDKPIPGQNFVCLSFISPDKVLENKERYFLKEFLKSMPETAEIANIDELFDTYLEAHQQQLESTFYEKNEFRTTVRGIKVRGVYDTKKEAEIRAQVLQRMDRHFHVFVGQVGYWLPWDPNANDIEDQVYMEKELNELMKHYRENENKRDMFYEEQTNARKTKAMEESQKNKQQQVSSDEASASTDEISLEEVIQQMEQEEDHLTRKQAFQSEVKKEN